MKYIIPGSMVGVILLATSRHISSLSSLFRQSAAMGCEIVGCSGPGRLCEFSSCSLSPSLWWLLLHLRTAKDKAFLFCSSEHCRMLEMERALGTVFHLLTPTPFLGVQRMGDATAFTLLRFTPKSRTPDHPCSMKLHVITLTVTFTCQLRTAVSPELVPEMRNA